MIAAIPITLSNQSHSLTARLFKRVVLCSYLTTFQLACDLSSLWRVKRCVIIKKWQRVARCLCDSRASCLRHGAGVYIEYLDAWLQGWEVVLTASDPFHGAAIPPGRRTEERTCRIQPGWPGRCRGRKQQTLRPRPRLQDLTAFGWIRYNAATVLTMHIKSMRNTASKTHACGFVAKTRTTF